MKLSCRKCGQSLSLGVTYPLAGRQPVVGYMQPERMAGYVCQACFDTWSRAGWFSRLLWGLSLKRTARR